MPLKIVRNDITKMSTDAIVNTANEYPAVGPGCDRAVYEAAGFDDLLSYRKENIGTVKEGDVFLTPGFRLPAKYIIHAVSPLYVDGRSNEEELLRSCYQKSLALAAEEGLRSIAFPLIATGSFCYPKEEGMRIAVDEINAFLLTHDMLVYLVVFDEKATRMGKNLYPDLEAYIDRNYVREKGKREYDLARESMPDGGSGNVRRPGFGRRNAALRDFIDDEYEERASYRDFLNDEYDERAPFRDYLSEKEAKAAPCEAPKPCAESEAAHAKEKKKAYANIRPSSGRKASIEEEDAAIEEMERKLRERIRHMSDTFPQYLLYLIKEKGMDNTEVYKRAIVDKKVFSKIKNNQDYHPQKLTALCLCVGAKLNLDESRDLLSRAGYALSPCDKTDIIFSYFIENEIYDMTELDIQLEEHGQPCIIK